MAGVQTRSLGRQATDRIRHNRGLRMLTAVAMVGFVVLVYMLVVIGGGALLGATGVPSLWLSVAATAIVAIAFEPVRTGVDRRLSRVLQQDRMSPYHVLARFPMTVSGAFPAEELPSRLAMVLAQGTCTAGAEVWLMVHGRLELAARWPAEPTPTPLTGAVGGDPTTTGAMLSAPRLDGDDPAVAPVEVVDGPRHSLAVRDRGELLGALTVVVHDGQQLTAVEERLFAGLAAQSGLVLRYAGLRAELEQQLAALERRTDELRRARRELIARQDAERKRLERNIHDGAQQEVIALLVNLRLAQTLLTRSPERGARLLAGQGAAARAAIDTLTALSLGLYPRLLTDAGPIRALAAAVESGPIPVVLTSADLPRLPPDVEAAVYFSCLEAVQNASKHSGASLITIDLSGTVGADGAGEIELAVTDDGRGFDPTGRVGNGLLNIADRIDCVQGSVSIMSAVGHGTTIRATIPTGAITVDTSFASARTVEDQPSGPSRVPVFPIAGG